MCLGIQIPPPQVPLEASRDDAASDKIISLGLILQSLIRTVSVNVFAKIY